MRVVAVVQARTGSNRLPGKVLMDLAGAPLIARVLQRASAAELVDEVVLATSDLPRDDELAACAGALGHRVHRGSEQDVLRRFREAADAAGADLVVRVTGDCPLIAPDVIDQVVSVLRDDPTCCDLASNVLRRTFPRGLDTEVLPIDVLHRMDRMATSTEAREHVTWHAYREQPERYVLRSVENPDDAHAALDWSVDDQADLDLVRDLYERFELADDPRRSWRELV